MTLGVRKPIVFVLVAAVSLPANVWLVANWLDKAGVIDLARHIRTEYLTGTAVTIIILLLVLLVRPRSNGAKLFGGCRVCDRVLLGRAGYCGECGSRA
jgi:hypothetical protein